MGNSNKLFFYYFIKAFFLSPILILGAAYFVAFYSSYDSSVRSWALLVFPLVANIVYAYRTARKNELRQEIIDFESREEFLERLDAILFVLGYKLANQSGDEVVYKPTYRANLVSRKIRITLHDREAVINGPEFALDHLVERFEFFNYPGIVLHHSMA